MANITIVGQLKSGGYTGVADSEDIAYSYKTEGGVLLIDKSIKDKIEELQNRTVDVNAEDVHYNNSNVKTVLDNIADLDTKVTNARLAATAAENALTLALLAQASIESTATDVALIKELALVFSTGFNADATFAVVSNAEYQSHKLNGTLTDNCIYFCYDN